MDLARVTVVLDKVRHPDNLGSALRAMKNCGLSRITLAAPFTRDFERARVMATDADDLLDGMQVAANLAAAVAPATLVAGTTSRRVAGRPSLWLHEFVRRAAEETAAGGEVAIVFGNEQRGLSDEELEQCQLVVSIPSAPAKASINLAQSVMLVAHACYMASLQGPPTHPAEPGARVATLQALWERMREVLLQADFLNRQNPDAVLSEVKRLIERARPTQRETELLLTAFKHLDRAIRLGQR